tara:strand:+ start:274 stop:495 length:222 start_codon:yes stop_codon:yes gene_type:complete
VSPKKFSQKLSWSCFPSVVLLNTVKEVAILKRTGGDADGGMNGIAFSKTMCIAASFAVGFRAAISALNECGGW